MVDRVREWLRIGTEHDDEHQSVRRDLTEQQLAVKRLEAYAKARTIRADRRRVVAAEHPDRRATD